VGDGRQQGDGTGFGKHEFSASKRKKDMAAIDLTERNLKIEHIEGFLYGIQEVENLILSSQGACFEYSILELNNNYNKSDFELVIETILDRIKFNDEITQQIRRNFNSNLKEETLKNWKIELYEILKKWFIDKHLSSKYIKTSSIEYMNSFENWTIEQKSKFTNQYKESERKTEIRINNTRVTIKTFIEMLEVFMKTKFELIRYNLDQVKSQEDLYPYSMSLYWGMECEIFLLRNSEQKILLHFGKLLN